MKELFNRKNFVVTYLLFTFIIGVFVQGIASYSFFKQVTGKPILVMFHPDDSDQDDSPPPKSSKHSK